MAQVVELGNVPFAIICTPFCICATVLNVFFLFCLCAPTGGVSIRQPMYLLLAAVLGNSTVQQLLVLISIILSFLSPPSWILVLNAAIIFQTYCSNFSSNAWISIFYYLKIVPQHWKVFIWIQKNIKAIVFAGFVFDQTLLMSALAMGTASYLLPVPTDDLNETVQTEKTVVNSHLYILAIQMLLVYLICPFCTLSVSWGRTFFYLRRHIRRMEQSTGSSAHLQQKNNMLVTVIGIVQTVLFIPTSLYSMIMALLLSTLYKTLDYNKHITITVMCVSNLANISCLGFSQSVFRLRMIALLKRVKKAFTLVDQS